MSINEMDSKARTYFEIMAQIEQLQTEAEAIKDSMKLEMVERGVEDLNGSGWKATWHNTNTKRFDSKRFKADYNDLYAAYTVSTTGTRFTLNQVRA